ncbi:TKL protein kinase, variant [Aphanomyces astaci]|uniref:TKL protein kinase, variant n=1 Tax=Aphanomyces astaci TaxID=112090 RepID=W4G839_APHAT|nr:TKL protein kinase, variant [Aphanomyces astaci]ETV75845.1 TKL protein kinase, variant [Aphanomyces astaci]|eukprot:XP_009834486.1 TKL protein kinase, variant [Aphanomyces astaci]
MPATSYVYEVPLFFLVLWRMVAVAAAADTAQCTALNQTYQSQYEICRNKSSTPYSSGREWCAVPSCADAIKAAAARRACGCEIELSCLPLSYCTDACLSDLEAYQSSHIACSEANQTLVVSSCAACQHMFPQYASFQASCQVQASSADAYVATFHNNLGAQFDYCIKQFPAAGLSFPTYELSSDHPSTSTLVPVILGVAAAVCVVAALGYVLYRRRQKPSRQQGGMCRLDAASGTDLSRYQPDSSTTLAAAAAGAPWLHAEGEKERSLTTLPLQDIRFDPEVAKYRIPKQSITDVTKLATGGFGIVFRAKVYGRDVAMKQLLPSKAKDLDATAEFMREIRLCARLNHQNIVPFVGIAWSTLVDLAVLSDLMPRGDVHELLQSERRFERVQNRRFHWRRAASPNEAADEMTTKTSVALDVGRAVSYLHDLSIIHRDLKAKNVLLSASFEAKLSDFGISRVSKLDETMTANVGTIAWIAPEVLLLL